LVEAALTPGDLKMAERGLNAEKRGRLGKAKRKT
jgi:hypothetical protein